jgi:hypothetical protein
LPSDLGTAPIDLPKKASMFRLERPVLLLGPPAQLLALLAHRPPHALEVPAHFPAAPLRIQADSVPPPGRRLPRGAQLRDARRARHPGGARRWLVSRPIPRFLGLTQRLGLTLNQLPLSFHGPLECVRLLEGNPVPFGDGTLVNLDGVRGNRTEELDFIRQRPNGGTGKAGDSSQSD